MIQNVQVVLLFYVNIILKYDKKLQALQLARQLMAQEEEEEDDERPESAATWLSKKLYISC